MGNKQSSQSNGQQEYVHGGGQPYPNTVYYNDRPYKSGRGPTYYVREDVQYDNYGRPVVYRRGAENNRSWCYPVCCCIPCIPCCLPCPGDC